MIFNLHNYTQQNTFKIEKQVNRMFVNAYNIFRNFFKQLFA